MPTPDISNRDARLVLDTLVHWGLLATFSGRLVTLDYSVAVLDISLEMALVYMVEMVMLAKRGLTAKTVLLFTTLVVIQA